MALQLLCPACSGKVSGPVELAGRTARCPTCQAAITVPEGQRRDGLSVQPRPASVERGRDAETQSVAEIDDEAETKTVNASSQPQPTSEHLDEDGPGEAADGVVACPSCECKIFVPPDRRNQYIECPGLPARVSGRTILPRLVQEKSEVQGGPDSEGCASRLETNSTQRTGARSLRDGRLAVATGKGASNRP